MTICLSQHIVICGWISIYVLCNCAAYLLLGALSFLDFFFKASEVTLAGTRKNDITFLPLLWLASSMIPDALA